MMAAIKLLTAAAILSACAACSPQPSGAITATIQLPPFDANTGAVFAGDKARELIHQCSRVSPGPIEGTWTPSSAEINQLEPELVGFLWSQPSRSGAGAEPWDYYRQYGGLIIGGRRVIYVNGFQRGLLDNPNPAHPFDWRTQVMSVCDGGDIVFGVEYDPATHAFAHFAFNGAI